MNVEITGKIVKGYPLESTTTKGKPTKKSLSM
jgi:hypothetical protein